MNPKFLVLVLFAANFLFTDAVAQNSTQGRNIVSFNSGWFFHKGDNLNVVSVDFDFLHWQSVQLPHTWNDKDVLADGERGYYRGISWYKKNFDLTPQKDKEYFLRFEGVNQIAEVYVNGKKAGKHIGGYNAFNIHLTPFLLSSGRQNISVKVDNSFNPDIPPLTADFTFFGGIYREVQLVETGKQHFSMTDYGGPGIYITTPQINAQRATVQVAYHLRNSESVAQRVQLGTDIQSVDNRSLAAKQTIITLPPDTDTLINVLFNNVTGYQLWSTENPALYYVNSKIHTNGVLTDNVNEPLGFKWFRFDADKGFFLNDKHVKLMGANRHQDRIPYGNALSNDMHRQDMQLLKEMGANFLRTAHYPQTRTVLAEADKNGILVWEEIPLVNEVTISRQHDYNAKWMLKEMIKQHFNHPSIIIWAYMNEIYWFHRFKPENEIEDRNKSTIALAKELEQLVHTLDGKRYTAMAMHNYPAYEETNIGSIAQIAAWNLYHGWYYDKFEDFGKFIDNEKKKHPERIHFISEYGAGSDTRIYSENSEKFDFSMEEQLKFTQSFIKQINERPFIAGAALWNLVDFSSEKRVDATSHMNNKGLVTHDRKPKDAYYLVKGLFSDKDFVQIGYPFRSKWMYAAANAADTLIPVNMNIFSNRKNVQLTVNKTHVHNVAIDNGMGTVHLKLPAGRHLLHTNDTLNELNYKLIHTELVPFALKDKNKIDLAVSLGSDYAFIDDRTGLYWLPEKEYQQGSWGFIGGEGLYIGSKVGTKEDLLGVVEEDPLYQTMRTDIRGFYADVPDGFYEIELLMADYVKKSRRFADEDEKVNLEPGKNIFDIVVNNVLMTPALDLGKSFGLNVPVRLKYKVKAENGQGIRINFNKIKGNPVASAIRIRSELY